MPQHYLDQASTTQVHPAVAQIVQSTLQTHWANPSSLYRAGMQAEQLLDEARQTLAKALGATPAQVVFTASGSEANNIAILGAARARKAWANHLVTTGYEHPSAAGPLAMLAKHEGFQLTVVPPGPDGKVELQQLVDAVSPKTALVCAMHVNNETGAVLDITALAAAVKQKNARTFVHVDGVQGFCKLPFAWGASSVDSYATSGHKLHAPKGVGALYLRNARNLLPPFSGGGQEAGIRPGTENTAYIAAYAKAVTLAQAGQVESLQTVQALRARLLAGLAAIAGITLHSPADGYPGVLMFSMPKGLRSQVMLNLLDERHDVCVSSGSACSGGAPSHTLQAMGLPAAQVDSALRVSFDGSNTEADIDALLAGLEDCLVSLQRRR